MAKRKFRVTDMVKALEESKGMVYVAARKMGCSPATIYKYAKDHPEIQATIDAQRGMMLDTAEMALWRALTNGEAWAISLTLKTIGKHRGYVERVEVEVNIALINRAARAIHEAGLDPTDVFEQLIAEAHAHRTDTGG
ncbi:hypothetical protein HC928_01445 [bacterium]|nr:hypothetical protein [bacterium]